MSATDRNSRIVGSVLVIMFGVLAFIGVGFAGMIAYSIERSATPVPPTPLAGWTIPGGFAMAQVDSEFAFRVDGLKPCERFSCFHMTLITAHGCPHALYVEVEGLDSGGAVSTHMDDRVGSVRADQEAKLRFKSVLATVTDVRISRVSCY